MDWWKNGPARFPGLDEDPAVSDWWKNGRSRFYLGAEVEPPLLPAGSITRSEGLDEGDGNEDDWEDVES